MIGNMTSTSELVIEQTSTSSDSYRARPGITRLVSRIARYFLPEPDYVEIEVQHGKRQRMQRFSNRGWSRHSALITEFYQQADKR